MASKTLVRKVMTTPICHNPVPLKRFLNLPVDETRHLTSPPCSPVPMDWHLMVEDSPRLPSPTEIYNSDVPHGMISLGDGRYINIQQAQILLQGLEPQQAASYLDDQLAHEHNRPSSLAKPFKIIRKHILISESSQPAREMVHCKDESTLEEMAPPHTLPIIIIDSYE